jgi:hypothetical protein
MRSIIIFVSEFSFFGINTLVIAGALPELTSPRFCIVLAVGK